MTRTTSMILTLSTLALSACAGGGDGNDDGVSGGFVSATALVATDATPLRTKEAGRTVPLRQHTATIVGVPRNNTRTLSGGDGSPANLTRDSESTLHTREFGDFRGLTLGSFGGTDTATNDAGTANVTLTSNRSTYVGFGTWAAEELGANRTVIAGFHRGAETPKAAIPRSGQASYRGSATGLLHSASSTGPRELRTFSGQAYLDVRFGAGNAVTGDIFGMQSGRTSMQALRLEGTMNGSGTGFSGVIAPNTATTGSVRFDSRRRGTFSGTFYGPNPTEVGGSGSFADSEYTLVVGFQGD